MRYFGKSIAFEIMFCVDSFGKLTGASKDSAINVWNCVSLITFLAHWLYLIERGRKVGRDFQQIVSIEPCIQYAATFKAKSRTPKVEPVVKLVFQVV